MSGNVIFRIGDKVRYVGIHEALRDKAGVVTAIDRQLGFVKFNPQDSDAASRCLYLHDLEHYTPVREMTEEDIGWVNTSDPLTTKQLQERIEDLEYALVRSIFAMHSTPLHQLPKGITMIDDDEVWVTLGDGVVVKARAP